MFYVSITRVKWNAAEARLDVTVRLFTDDLEEAIVQAGGPRLRLWTDGAREDRDRHVGGLPGDPAGLPGQRRKA